MAGSKGRPKHDRDNQWWWQKWDLFSLKCLMSTYSTEYHYISILLYLEREIFYTLCPFYSWGNWRPRTCQKLCMFSCPVRVSSVAQSCSTHLTTWTVAHQALLAMGLYRKEYWSGLPFPSPRDLPNPGVKPESPVSPALVDRFFITEPPGKPVRSHPACQSSSRKLWWHCLLKAGESVRPWCFSPPPSDHSQAVLSLLQLNSKILHLCFLEIFGVVYLTLLEYRYSERRLKNQKKKDFPPISVRNMNH